MNVLYNKSTHFTVDVYELSNEIYCLGALEYIIIYGERQLQTNTHWYYIIYANQNIIYT